MAPVATVIDAAAIFKTKQSAQVSTVASKEHASSGCANAKRDGAETSVSLRSAMLQLKNGRRHRELGREYAYPLHLKTAPRVVGLFA